MYSSGTSALNRPTELLRGMSRKMPTTVIGFWFFIITCSPIGSRSPKRVRANDSESMMRSLPVSCFRSPRTTPKSTTSKKQVSTAANEQSKGSPSR